MSLLRKIKGLFKQKSQEKIEESTDIESRLDIESHIFKKDKEIEKLLNDKINALYTELSPLLIKLEKDAEILASVNISDKKVEEKLKQITELGRNGYIAAIRKLIAGLKQKKAIGHISEKLNNFMANSAKSHFKATVLIGKEIEAVMDDIKAIRKLDDDFAKGNSSFIKESNNIKALIEKLKKKKQNEEKRYALYSEIEGIKGINKKYNEHLGEIIKKIQETEKSPEHKNREILITKKGEKHLSLQKIESEIRTLLDKRALEKYSYIEQNKENKAIINSYLENPLNALLSDENLKIKIILNSTKEKIAENAISIKETDKAIEKIELAIKNIVIQRENILLLNKEIKEIEGELSAIKTDLSSLLNEKSEIGSKITENENQLSILGKKHEKLCSEISAIDEYLSQEVLKTNPSHY